MYKFSLKQIIVIIALITAETIAQSCLNNGVTEQFKFVSKNVSIVAGMISYSFIAYIYYLLIQTITRDNKGKNALNIANSIWNVGIQVSIAVISWAAFGQNMTKKNWIGIVLMSLGLTLVI
tara:strand:+ start:428 stop:790 length:363 start_codon:yes stop_codon:yes gene_type:complete